LLALGSGLLFLGGATAPRPAGASALALVALAGAAAVLAARGWMRRLVGVVLFVTGVAAVVLGVAAPAWAAVLGGVAVAVGGVWVVGRGPGWSRLSERYVRDSPPSDAPHALWDALDRGEDPTS
jgi:hypothetical protein